MHYTGHVVSKLLASGAAAFVAIVVLFVSLPLQSHSLQPAGVRAAPLQPAGLRIISSDSDGLILELDTPAYQIQTQTVGGRAFQKLTVVGLNGTAEPGKPQLPLGTALLGVPPDAQVAVEVLGDEVQPLAGAYDILPVPSPAPLAQDLTPGRVEYIPDASTYGRSAAYPETIARVADEAWLRDQRLVRIEVAPFQYMPAQRQLFWHRSIKLAVRFTRPANHAHNSPPLGSPTADQANPFEAVLRGSLLNYDQARAWRAAPEAYNAVPLARTTMQRPVDTSPRYKIVVDHDGLYRITYADLQAAGLDVDTIDPRTFHLTNQGRDVAIEVAGETDGHFNSADSILFYGQRLRGDVLAARFAVEANNWLTFTNGWHPQFNATMVERYTDDNVYWLTAGGTAGPRMPTADGTPGGGAPTPDYFTATVHAEQANLWQTTTFSGEDPFFWEKFSAAAPVTRSYTTTLPAAATAPVSVTVRGVVAAGAYNAFGGPDHRTRVFLNSPAALVEDATWDGQVRHTFSGTVPQSVLSGSRVVTLLVNAIPQPALPIESLLFDWFEINYARRFEAQADQLLFTGNQIGARQYRISQFTTNSTVILNISDPLLPQHILTPSVTGGGGTFTATFEVTHSTPVTYFVASAAMIQHPKSVSRYVPIDLSGGTGADYIIITHQAFVTDVQALADYHAAQGLRVRVVDLEDIFNQYTDGIYHSIAIKAFLADAYANWPKPAPTYVLLVGDGQWNLKGYTLSTGQGQVGPSPIYMPPHLSWVDPWQGEVDSANLLVAVAGNDILPDMYVGRLPVNNSAELNSALDKIINYELAGIQDYQRRVMFVADNTPDPNYAGDFVASSETVINNYLAPEYAADRIYENDFGCVSFQLCPAVNDAIVATLHITGELFVNYTGHGSSAFWADEKIFTDDNIPQLANLNRLPIIVSMTCLDGYWIHPKIDQYSALSELHLRTPNGGAVGAFSPTGLGLGSGHDALAQGFYTAVFSDGVQSLGAAAEAAKLALFATHGNFDLIDTFTVFGDPALRLPTYQLDVSPATSAKAGGLGATLTYTLRVTNAAFMTDSLAISTGGNAWPVSLAPVNLSLPSHQSANIVVSVTIPMTAAVDSSDRVTVAIQSHGDRTRVSAVITSTASALSLHPASAIRYGSAGTTLQYAMQITNLTAVADTVDLTSGGHDWPVIISPGSFALSPGGSRIFTVAVTIPTTATPGSQDSVTIAADSQVGGAHVAATLTTIANAVAGMSLAPPVASDAANPAGVVTYTLWATNTGYLTSSLALSTAGNHWPVAAALPVFDLPVGSSIDLLLFASVPGDALAGATDSVTVTIVDDGHPIAQARLTSRANAVYGGTLFADPTARTGSPGQTVTYTVHLTNTGNTTDIFDLEANSLWSTSLSTSSLMLAPYSGSDFDVWVSVPPLALANRTDVATLRAISRGNGATALIGLTTTKKVIDLYLPLVRK